VASFRLFELWCLHIPVHDRTPFTGLVKLVEDTVIEETKRRPQSPIYLVGDSLGAVLALAVAARNPELDLVLILSNPATSFDRSQLQLLFPFLQNTLPSVLSTVAPLLLSFTLGTVFATTPPLSHTHPPMKRFLLVKKQLINQA
jgi:alpha-beta hydrolase superfamily lysophospholipase